MSSVQLTFDKNAKIMQAAPSDGYTPMETWQLTTYVFFLVASHNSSGPHLTLQFYCRLVIFDPNN